MMMMLVMGIQTAVGVAGNATGVRVTSGVKKSRQHLLGLCGSWVDHVSSRSSLFALVNGRHRSPAQHPTATSTCSTATKTRLSLILNTAGHVTHN